MHLSGMVSPIAIGLGFLTLAAPPAAAQSQPTLPADLRSGWELVPELSDEFDGARIDGVRWDADVEDWGPWSWEPGNATVDDGTLRLTIRYEPHRAARRAPDASGPSDQQLFYKSGIVRSRGYQTYGYYEARIKGVPTYPGSSPAFWIYSIAETNKRHGFTRGEGAVTYSEVDIVELQQGGFVENAVGRDGPEVIDMNLHMRMIENGKEIWKRPGNFPELAKNRIEAGFDPRDDFHIYGARVSPEEVIWYIDGVEVARKPNLYWHLPMYVTLSLGLRSPHVTYRDCADGFWRCPVPGAATGDGYPASMEVDWVRSWHRADEPRIGSPQLVKASTAVERGAPPQSSVFKPGADADGDGRLSPDEFVMFMGTRELQIRDADKDGKISAVEWLGDNEGGFQRLTLDRFNADGNDEMSVDEIVRVFLWIFSNRDKNKDGFLSAEESAPPTLAR